MNKLMLIAVMSGTALADAPKLIAVDTANQPLKLQAPDGWNVSIKPPARKDMSVIASISPRCAGGPDISFAVQLDQEAKSAVALLAGQYKGKQPTKLHGWDCITDKAHTEVMCAGKLSGLAGIVDVYFATTSDKSFKQFGDPAELTAQIAAGLSWKGKLADLTDWSRDATDAAKSACK